MAADCDLTVTGHRLPRHTSRMARLTFVHSRSGYRFCTCADKSSTLGPSHDVNFLPLVMVRAGREFSHGLRLARFELTALPLVEGLVSLAKSS